MSDLNMLHYVTSLLAQLVAHGHFAFASNTLSIFQELLQIANLFLARELHQSQPAQSSTPASIPTGTDFDLSQPASASPDTSSQVPDIPYPNQYFEEMTLLNDRTLSLINPQTSFPLDETDGFAPGDWFSPMDIQWDVGLGKAEG
jgi:hypothetical protein